MLSAKPNDALHGVDLTAWFELDVIPYMMSSTDSSDIKKSKREKQYFFLQR
jgi:hypothetical protein